MKADCRRWSCDLQITFIAKTCLYHDDTNNFLRSKIKSLFLLTVSISHSQSPYLHVSLYLNSQLIPTIFIYQLYKNEKNWYYLQTAERFQLAFYTLDMRSKSQRCKCKWVPTIKTNSHHSKFPINRFWLVHAVKWRQPFILYPICIGWSYPM